LISAINGARIVIILANILHAPNTDEVCSTGNKSAVTRYIKLKALFTPNLVIKKQNSINKVFSAGMKAMIKPNIVANRYDRLRLNIVPILSAINPDKRQDIASIMHE
jgi:hypothetical protein